TGQRGVNSEMLSWLFMRASGLLLVILVFGHLFVNLWLGEGVKGIDVAFVGGKWSAPFWQVCDLLMLWRGLIHGGNGARTLSPDAARSDRLRRRARALLHFAVAATILLGALVLFPFDPCPAGAEPRLLPSPCEGCAPRRAGARALPPHTSRSTRNGAV